MAGKLQGGKELKTVQDLFEQVKESIFKKLSFIKGQRKRDIISRALMFSRVNKNVLVIIADPKTDNIIASYNSHYSAAQIKTKFLKRNTGVVKAVLEREGDEKEVEKKVSEFLQFIDAFVYQTANEIKKAEVDKQNKITKLCQEQKNQSQPNQLPIQSVPLK
jgi:hypothetical protein